MLISFRTLILTLLFLAVAAPASADMGPKPRMGFTFLNEGVDEAVTVEGGDLFTNGERLEERGPQGFACIENRCSALAYGFGETAHLELMFSDGKLRKSPPFEPIGFDSDYVVTVTPAALSVSPSASSVGWFWGLRIGAVAIPLLLLLTIFLVVWRRRHDR